MNLTKADQAVLRDFFLFQSLTGEQQVPVFEELAAQSFPKGEMIYTQHHFKRSLGIVTAGEVAVLKGSGAMLNLLTAGQCLGAAALFAQIAEYVTELQARKACRIVFISDQELTLLFQRYPQMALDYITFLSGRIQFLNQKIDSFTTPSAQEAVWNWLVAHANAQGCVTASGGLTRLAKELNIGRATLYRSLAHLEEKGYIVKQGAQIMILHCQSLEGLIK